MDALTDQQLHDRLRPRVDDGAFELWLADLTIAGHDRDGELVLVAPGQKARVLARRFGGILDSALGGDAPHGWRIEPDGWMPPVDPLPLPDVADRRRPRTRAA